MRATRGRGRCRVCSTPQRLDVDGRVERHQLHQVPVVDSPLPLDEDDLRGLPLDEACGGSGYLPAEPATAEQ